VAERTGLAPQLTAARARPVNRRTLATAAAIRKLVDADMPTAVLQVGLWGGEMDHGDCHFLARVRFYRYG
jgi:hypothetical protein